MDENRQQHDISTRHCFDSYIAKLNSFYDDMLENGFDIYGLPIEKQNNMWIEYNGQKKLILASYSYLGLLGHEKINNAVTAILDKFGTGTHGVRVLSGNTILHEELEKTIASFKQTEDAIVFSSGYVTNISLIATLVKENDYIICDQLNHASIIDGCKLSRANLVFFKHNNMQDLERILDELKTKTKFIIADAVFSMDGDIVDLPTLLKLAETYGAQVIIDEAHSLGVIGKAGKGIEEYFNLVNSSFIKMGTLSKTIPAMGGYVAGSKALIKALKSNARAFLFSAALSPILVEAAKISFNIIEQEYTRVEKLHENAHYFNTNLKMLGFDTMHTKTAIVPILCKNITTALQFSKSCQDKGLFLFPIVYPSVPINTPRIRAIVTANHSKADIDYALSILKTVGKELSII